MKFKNTPDQKKHEVELKPITIPPVKKEYHIHWGLLKTLLALTVIVWALYGVQMFVNTHDFRTPIIIQNPFPVKKTITPTPTIQSTPSVTPKPTTLKGLLEYKTKEVFGQVHVEAMMTLVFRESTFNPMAMNKKTGACGLFQFYPCTKLTKVCPDMNVECQIDQGIQYIQKQYGNPINALAFHYEHNYY